MIINNINYKLHNKTNLISCILITYRQSKYVCDCLNTILKQKNVNIELIISDDGTPNYSSEEIEKYVEENRNDNLFSVIYMHHKTNVGTVRNINDAIKRCSGEYIKIIGGDDGYPDEYVFWEQIKALESTPNKLVVVGKIIDCNDKLLPISNKRIEDGNELLLHIFEMQYAEARKVMMKKNLFPIANQASCFRKEFFDKYGLCDETYKVVEDAELSLRILEHKNEAMVLNKICVYHRQKGGISTSRIMFEPRRLAYYEDFVTFSKIQSKIHPEIFDPISRFEIPRVNEYVYRMAKSKAKNESDCKRIIISLAYLDTIMYYVFSKPKRLLSRLVDRFHRSNIDGGTN